MRFGVSRLGWFFVVFMAVGSSPACAQSKEMKILQSEQHAERAVELILAVDPPGAVRELLKAVDLNPDNPELLISLADYYRLSKEFVKSKEVAEKALKLMRTMPG